jgi:translation initiation factor IF-2
MMQNRPPIVVVLGHVDHGKTTLLDYLRNTNIASHEAGGITQATRSFQLDTSKILKNKSQTSQTITFIDTPGHAAFSQMRSRGSKVADIALLVIASDDGVMPQTRQSLEFIQTAGIPFIIVFTKSDLPEANPDRIKTQLTELKVVVEELGGPVSSVSISAKNGTGIPDLLELIYLMAELNPPQADPDGPLELLILESRMDSKKGPMAAVIVKNGSLTTGQSLFQIGPVGKVRAITDSDGHILSSSMPSQPVEILGLSTVLAVGSVISDSPTIPTSVSTPTSHTSTTTVFNLILRADVAGSLEAILSQLSPEINVISATTGDISETDISSAQTTKAKIVGFNVHIPNSVAKLAEVEKVPIYTYNIIYELLDKLEEMLHPKVKELVLGKAVITAEFKINIEKIAGCRCSEGIIKRSDTIRILRGETNLGEIRLKSLKSGKNNIESVKTGQEFGAVFSPFIDFKPGDIIIAYTQG